MKNSSETTFDGKALAQEDSAEEGGTGIMVRDKITGEGVMDMDDATRRALSGGRIVGKSGSAYMLLPANVDTTDPKCPCYIINPSDRHIVGPITVQSVIKHGYWNEIQPEPGLLEKLLAETRTYRWN